MKMKIVLTIVLTILSLWSFAQPTGDIEKDTALANQYLKEAIQVYESNMISTRSLTLLEQAHTLYEAYPFHEKFIEIKSWLGLQKELGPRDTIIIQAINLAKTKMPDVEYPTVLAPAYLAIFNELRQADTKLALQYALKGRMCANKNSKLYYKISARAASVSSYLGNHDLADSLITELTTYLEVQNNDNLNRYWLYVYQAKSEYYQFLNNYEQFLIYNQKMLIENETYQELSHGELYNSYTTRAVAYSRLRDLENALLAMKKAKTYTASIRDTPMFGTYYSKMAFVYGENRNYPKAIEYFKKAIELYLKDEEKFYNRIGGQYVNLGIAYNSIGKHEEAIKSLRASERYIDDPFIQLQLGVILQRQEKYGTSLEKLQEGLVKLSIQFSDTSIYKNPSKYEQYKNNRFAVAILFEKAQTWCLYGRKEMDKTKLEESIKVAELVLYLNELKHQAIKGFEKSRNLYNEDLVATLQILLVSQQAIYELEPSIKNFNACFHTAERLKAIQLVETLSPSPLPQELYLQEQQLIEQLQYNGQRLDLFTYSLQKDSIQYYQNALFETSQRLEKYMEYVKANYPEEANNFYHIEYASLGEIQKKLPKKTLLIEYIDVPLVKETFIIAVSQLGNKIYQSNSTNLVTNIKKLNELIQDPFAFQNGVRDEFIDVSHELYNALIKPIESELEGKTELMIVVEGNLFHLPFELLLSTNEKKPYHELDFLIKKYAINYHYSATAFLKLQEKTTVKDNSLLAFAPVFSRGEELNEATRSLDFLVDSLYNGIDGNEFVALPSTKKEIKSIAKIVKSNNGQTNILLQKNATKTNFGQALESQSYQFVHIATHGLVNFKNPRLSALACYSKDGTMNNLLFANEIQFKDINADLVILSSCESGIGQLVDGEGLIALNRSFIYSGAKNVLFSLWKVSDKYSSDLMIDFYENYYQGQSYTEALRNAKLKMLSNPTSAQPKFWSAFVLMGK